MDIFLYVGYVGFGIKIFFFLFIKLNKIVYNFLFLFIVMYILFLL